MKEIKSKTIIADESCADQRLDNFLVKLLKGVPKSHIYLIIRTGQVRVNSKRIRQFYKLNVGDTIRIPPIRISDTVTISPPTNLLQLLKNHIIYEDNDILIINKPAGIACHGGSGINFGVIESLRALFPKLKSLELVHRLDRDTSGCLMLAKKRSVLTQIQQEWQTGAIKKVYLALLKGNLSKPKIIVDVPLTKNILSSGERIVKAVKDGKPAKTEIHLIKNFADYCLVKVILHTGRTHQIRVHAAYIGHNVAGDEKYGYHEFNKLMKSRGLKRLFLHAQSLEFSLPKNGKKLTITAELDEELQKFTR
jgi:23S rRNA pseudouridine955/2504/2580 synthase